VRIYQDEQIKEFVLEYPKRPWTTNSERAGNRWKRAELTKEWRQAFMLLAKQAKIPRLGKVFIRVEPFQLKGKLQDTASCNPAVKAAIDGLVDAGVIKDDTPEFLPKILFCAPEKGREALRLVIIEIRDDEND